MKELLERADEIPVTLVVLLAYLTMAFLTDPVSPRSAQLVEYGAGVGMLIMDGEPWRLLSHAFLHGGFLHLAFNSYCLFAIGPGLEMRLGSVKFAILYIVGALAGGIAGSLWHSPIAPLVGGSGALFGMFGAMLAINMRQGRYLLDFLNYHGPRMVVTLILFNLGLGLFIRQISNAAHIGGLIAGFALAFCFLERGRAKAVDGIARAIQIGWIAVLAAWLAYCLHPVARVDYALRRAVRGAPAEQREQIEADYANAAPWVADRVSRWLRGK